QFGANIFVADLVALSVTRELAPLMTAIIVAGRSGAAFSAELGTMRVSEEVDALRTLGLDPYSYLVFPRVIALVLVVPLLTLIADVVGILGGLLVALFGLDLTLAGYLHETQKSLELFDVFSSTLKAAVFGVNIALIACQRGLATRGGAEGVGRATTSAVVTSLFAIVAADAVFTVLFLAFGHCHTHHRGRPSHQGVGCAGCPLGSAVRRAAGRRVGDPGRERQRQVHRAAAADRPRRADVGHDPDRRCATGAR